MENNFGVDDHIELPPGFRFHPTDEELITHYLLKKVLDSCFSAIAIGEVDMNKVEPWELPWRAKLGEKEWYFFCTRDKKYPTGMRTNRATATGYWKATGKDREIFRGKALVGMKKTLVFYKGRAPKGEKSNWVAHEYRLEGELSLDKLPKAAKNGWGICRVFHKTSGGKKVHISGLMRMDAEGNAEPGNSGHVHCFSRPVTATPEKIQEDLLTSSSDPIFPYSSNPVDSFPIDSFSREPIQGEIGFRFPDLIIPFQDPIIFRNTGQSMNQGFIKDREIVNVSQETGKSHAVSNMEMEKKSFEEHEAQSTSAGLQDFDCIWSCSILTDDSKQ